MDDLFGRWPGVDQRALREAFDSAVGERSLSPELRAELALSRACALGDAAAIDELDAILVEQVARAVRPINVAIVDDVTQLVRERLLVPAKDGRRRIADFSADGSLAAWLRAIAVRTALNVQRSSAGREQVAIDERDGEAEILPLAASDPELELFRARHRDAFRACFAKAVASLSPRDRTVLRLHTLEGMPLAKIGTMYAKDTSTVWRWLEQIRKALREATCAQLAETLSLSPSELQSVMRAADTEVSVSLARLLAE